MNLSPEFTAFLKTCCEKHGLRFFVGTEDTSTDHIPAPLRKFAVTEADMPTNGKPLVTWRKENDGGPLEKSVREILRCHLGAPVP